LAKFEKNGWAGGRGSQAEVWPGKGRGGARKMGEMGEEKILSMAGASPERKGDAEY